MDPLSRVEESVPTELMSEHIINELRPDQELRIFRSTFSSDPVVVPPPGLTLHSYVLQNIENYLDRVAFLDATDGHQYTYGQVLQLLRNVAAGLWFQFGIRKGDVVIIVLPNTTEYFIFVIGIISLGAIYRGSNPAAHESEIQRQAKHSGEKLVITDLKTHKKVEALSLPVVVVAEDVPKGSRSYTSLFEADGSLAPTVEISEHDVCALPYSSGTTGVPRGVMITHRNIVANLNQTVPDVESKNVDGIIPDGERVVLGLMPFFHIYGIIGICCATVRMKGKEVVVTRYSLEEFLDILTNYGVTFAPVAPPILLQLVKTDFDNLDCSKFRLNSVLTAADPLGIELQKAFETIFPGVEVHQAYGLTEYSCVTVSHCICNHGRGPSKPGTVGFIVPGLEVKFEDPTSGLSLPANSSGEICVRGEPTMKGNNSISSWDFPVFLAILRQHDHWLRKQMSGYFKHPEATAATIDSQGWLHTGDIGYIDNDGDILIVERMKEVIKYNGFQVCCAGSPAEIEAILISHPAIADAAVVPIPDEVAGEIPGACVVLKHGFVVPPTEIQAFVASKVSTYKQIRHVEFVSSVPKSPAGKILRRVLKEQIVKGLRRTKAQQ
ncbi:4-coumarate--CoA ligase-like 1 [Physcomitrium patens]|uniref:4-coumarate--CoA ligase-like 1 n=1 Tax=Physcomitrium patens TaxID=3218 RepID=UPI003CCDBCBF